VAIRSLWWDLDDDPDGNVQHIAEHGLSKEEVEEVLAAPSSRGTSDSSGLPLVFGWTSTGRYILVAVEDLGPDGIRPVTAYDVPPPQARRRGKRRGR
jgi:hypothetical protein